jgi:tetrahedral aminopeptidase
MREVNPRKEISLHLASTVQEELGMRGAVTASEEIKPHIAFVLDVANASDDPSCERKKQPQCDLGKGPAISCGPNTNRALKRMLVNCAERHKIPYQVAPSGETEGNDAKKIQIANHGVATVTLGLPNRNMHTQAEICDLADLENTVKLLVSFLCEFDPVADLRPFRV